LYACTPRPQRDILGQLNIFERKVCRIVLDPVYDNKKGNLRILTNKKFMMFLKNYHNRDNNAA
jgi:hypothetical protein